jgi:tetratricopeptide (TPR) repeat protein
MKSKLLRTGLLTIILSISVQPVLANQYESEEKKGLINTIEKDYKGAIYHYKKAIALRKNNTNDYLILEKLFGFIGENDKAVKALEEGVKNNPKDINLLLRLGYHKELNGQYSEAKELYNKALEVDKTNNYAKKGIARIENYSAFKSYTEYKQTDSNTRDRSGINAVNDNFKQTLATQRFSKLLDGDYTLGAEVHVNKFENDFTTDHVVDEQTYQLTLAKMVGDIYLYGSIGKSEFDADDIGSGASGKEDITSGSFMANYQSARNSTTLSFSKDYYALNQTSFILMEELELLDLQNQYSLTKEVSLLARVTQGVSENLDYIIYNFSPNYNVNSVEGLSVYLSFEGFDNKDSVDYSEQALGVNYARDWSDKFETTFWVEYGQQDTVDRKFLFSELVSKYNMTQSMALILTLEASHNYQDEDIDSHGASLALDMHF